MVAIQSLGCEGEEKSDQSIFKTKERVGKEGLLQTARVDEIKLFSSFSLKSGKQV
jgi:hypothetical protein